MESKAKAFRCVQFTKKAFVFLYEKILGYLLPFRDPATNQGDCMKNFIYSPFIENDLSVIRVPKSA
jgi:hypothetical protein